MKVIFSHFPPKRLTLKKSTRKRNNYSKCNTIYGKLMQDKTLREEMEKYGIGNTIFTRSRNIEKLIDVRKIYLKFEGGNPTGSMKDRAAYTCLKLAKEEGYEKVGVASCGNLGASIVHFSQIFDLEPHIFIPLSFQTPRIEKMAEDGGIIHRVEGTYEEAVERSKIEIEKHGWFDGNPGTEENIEASIKGYSLISYEILEQLGHPPDVIAVPTGNGTILSGIHHGWEELLREGRIEELPRMISASTSGGNPIVESFLQGKERIENLDPGKVRETRYNEALVNWMSLDGQLALDSIYESKGWATYITDEEMMEYSGMLAENEGLLVLPASASALRAIEKYAEKEGEMDYVAFLTARRFL
jgi:threonine synthase